MGDRRIDPAQLDFEGAAEEMPVRPQGLDRIRRVLRNHESADGGPYDHVAYRLIPVVSSELAWLGFRMSIRGRAGTGPCCGAGRAITLAADDA